MNHTQRDLARQALLASHIISQYTSDQWIKQGEQQKSIVSEFRLENVSKTSSNDSAFASNSSKKRPRRVSFHPDVETSQLIISTESPASPASDIAIEFTTDFQECRQDLTLYDVDTIELRLPHEIDSEITITHRSNQPANSHTSTVLEPFCCFSLPTDQGSSEAESAKKKKKKHKKKKKR